MQSEKNWVNADSRCYFMRFMNLDENPSPEEIQIEWYPENDKGFIVKHVYPGIPSSELDFLYRNYVFRINLSPGEKKAAFNRFTDAFLFHHQCLGGKNIPDYHINRGKNIQ